MVLGQGLPRWESDPAGTLVGHCRMDIGVERRGQGVILGVCRREAPLTYVQEKALEGRFRLTN